MNRNDFRNPLILTGVILLTIFFFIFIVTNSPAEGFVGSTIALISGLFKGVVFLFGLSLSLVVSILILIGIFFAATSFDKVGIFYQQAKAKIDAGYKKYKERWAARERKKERAPVPKSTSHPTTPPEQTSSPGETHQQAPGQEMVEESAPAPPGQSQLNKLAQATDSLNQNITRFETRLAELEERVARLDAAQQSQPQAAPAAPELNKQVLALESTIDTFGDFEQSVTQQLADIRSSLSALDEKTTIPTVVSGIFSYIDNQQDREAFTNKVEEAVSRGMTYAQADAFFKKSLPAKVYKTLALHPRLTKDFIRSIKKKFS